ncbi:MAG: DUF805 domain-containing protein [Bacteroidales bacterium]|nr:DUF805 domain-containing protein [Bacteroidales bacterium]
MAKVVPQLDFMAAIKLAFSRLKETTGRSRRSEFWWAFLAIYVGSYLVGYILGLIPGVGVWLKFLVQIVGMIVTLPLLMRRMHDTGKGNGLVWAYAIVYGLFLLSFLITAISIKSGGFGGTIIGGIFATILSIALAVVGIILLIMCIKDSEGENKYGPSPKYPEGKPATPAQ